MKHYPTAKERTELLKRSLVMLEICKETTEKLLAHDFEAQWYYPGIEAARLKRISLEYARMMSKFRRSTWND